MKRELAPHVCVDVSSVAATILTMLSPIALGCVWKRSKLQIIECFEKVISLPKILSYLFEASQYVSIVTIISHVTDTETGVGSLHSIHVATFQCWSDFVRTTHPLFFFCYQASKLKAS